MRRKLVLGVSLAGLLSGSSAVAQFAADRVSPGAPQPTAQAPGFQPAPATYPPPVGGVSPAAGNRTPGGFVPPTYGPNPAAPPNTFTPAPTVTPAALPVVDIPRALPADHPWALQPQTGPFFICVKSYSRPARPDPNDPGLPCLQLAEALATEIRDTFKVQAFLFEYISEEKRAEAEARAKALQQARAFQAATSQIAQRSQLQGMQFMEPDRKYSYKTFRYRDQIAVLVGPFQTEADAMKAVAIVKKWPEPKDKRLMDGGVIIAPGGNGQMIDKGYLNPYPQAMVVANPAIAKAAPAPTDDRVEKFVVQLNEGRPYNLLMATRGTWTLAVKSFGSPVLIQSKDEDTGMMRRMGLSSGADVLAAGAGQAEQLAKALREMKGPAPACQPLNLEAFVLHTRSSSIVTVGQFDGPNDPALLETRRLLSALSFNVGKEPQAAGMPGAGQKLFGDTILPIPIPRP